MAIASTDIKFKLSTTSGSAGNSTSGTPAGSLGKYMSTTEMSGTSLNNLFDDISGDENAASTVDYRCFFVHNTHATLTYLSAVFWVSSEVSGGANVAIAVDNTGVVAQGAATAQAGNIATETTAPTTIVAAFSTSATSKAAGLSLGDIPAGQCRAVWVKRSATNSAAIDNDGITFNCAGDTNA